MISLRILVQYVRKYVFLFLYRMSDKLFLNRIFLKFLAFVLMKKFIIEILLKYRKFAFSLLTHKIYVLFIFNRL